ncbi:hypothetical protein ANCDUO_10159 [Ancylostoma duodenale]|uniref:Ig-like domain-containing protein n=1 Tax=Ancylostoma duodenale TaxID=51022 RepID=A0A0C2CS01_9BILA|nr:hypothetical protein ANCDUO_10159 [Ancylostoma duodenale]
MERASGTPPTIQPEKLNVTADSRKTVVLPCNATGIPEPVVSWVKAPNIQIEANERRKCDIGHVNIIIKQNKFNRGFASNFRLPPAPTLMSRECPEDH